MARAVGRGALGGVASRQTGRAARALCRRAVYRSQFFAPELWHLLAPHSVCRKGQDQDRRCPAGAETGALFRAAFAPAFAQRSGSFVIYTRLFLPAGCDRRGSTLGAFLDRWIDGASVYLVFSTASVPAVPSQPALRAQFYGPAGDGAIDRAGLSLPALGAAGERSGGARGAAEHEKRPGAAGGDRGGAERRHYRQARPEVRLSFRQLVYFHIGRPFPRSGSRFRS